MITNCTNCGAPLDKDGTCSYCGTHHKIPNILDVPKGQILDLELRFKMGDNVCVMPLSGYVSTLEVIPQYDTYRFICGDVGIVKTSTSVRFVFDGVIRDENNQS